MRWIAHITITEADGGAADMRLSIDDDDLTMSSETVARYQLMASAAGIWQANNADALIASVEILSISHSSHGSVTVQ